MFFLFKEIYHFPKWVIFPPLYPKVVLETMVLNSTLHQPYSFSHSLLTWVRVRKPCFLVYKSVSEDTKLDPPQPHFGVGRVAPATASNPGPSNSHQFLPWHLSQDLPSQQATPITPPILRLHWKKRVGGPRGTTWTPANQSPCRVASVGLTPDFQGQSRCVTASSRPTFSPFFLFLIPTKEMTSNSYSLEYKSSWTSDKAQILFKMLGRWQGQAILTHLHWDKCQHGWL